MVELVDQLHVIHQVAVSYWQADKDQVKNDLDAIKIIKRNGGKVSGFLPAFDTKPSVFFKVYFYDRGFQFESQGLKAANDLPPIEGFRVPQIVKIMPEYKALLMEKRSWQDTESELKRFFVNSMGFDWCKIGLWLRAFHDSHVSYDLNEYFLKKKFQKIKSHIEALHSLFSLEELIKIREIIKNAQEYFQMHDCEWVISHGDFLLGNIHLSNYGMDIIDFEDCQMAPREFDCVNFLARLEYADYFPNKKGTYAKILEQFFEGYGKPINPDSLVYDFYYLFVKLDAIETYYRRKQQSKDRWYQRWIYRYFETKGLDQLKYWLHNK